MTIDLVRVGQAIEQVRLAKHISRQKLAADLGLSEKTLQRIAKGQVDMKLTQYLRVLDYLGLTSAEIQQARAEPGQDFAVLDDQIQQLVLAADVAGLKALATKLARPAEEGWPWRHTEQLICELYVAQLTADKVQARAIAAQVFAGYSTVEIVTTFDLRVLASVLAYVPFGLLRQSVLFTQVQSKQPLSPRLEQEAQNLVTRVYAGLLASAVKSGGPEDVQLVAQIVLAHPAADGDLSFPILQQFCNAVAVRLAGEPERAQTMETTLVQAVADIDTSADFNLLGDYAQVVWLELLKMPLAAAE